MADNVTLPATGTGTGTPIIAADDVSSVMYQRIKLDGGGDGATVPFVAGQQTMAASLPVVVASNQSNLPVALAAGTNAIGKLAANSGVDIGDVDVASIAAGDNNIGNVDIVTLPVAAYVTKQVTIASGQSLSGATTDNSGYRLIALQMPAAWTTAAINFQGSVDGVTYGIWYTAYNSAAISVPSGGAVADNYVQVDWADTHAPPYLKVRSGTAASPVNQAADRTLTLVFAPIR